MTSRGVAFAQCHFLQERSASWSGSKRLYPGGCALTPEIQPRKNRRVQHPPVGFGVPVSLYSDFAIRAARSAVRHE